MDPVLVGLPLRGEWVAVNTPAFRVPSHGTDQLGQRYAYDFLRLGGPRSRHYKGSPFQLWTVGVRTADCYAHGRPVVAPFDGRVAEARDGLAERPHLWPPRDLLGIVRASLAFGPRLESMTMSDLRPLVGNYVIMERDGLYALCAHLAPGSIHVAEGAMVREGELLGRVGHTGNSTAPHLHFQLMDGPDAAKAKGVPCAFREYEEWTGRGWRSARGSMPGRMVRIRSGADPP